MGSVLDMARGRPAKKSPEASVAAERATPLWVLVLATATSAVLLWFGTGLNPISGLTWLAPLPLFAVAARASSWAAACAAALAWSAGELNMWTYFRDDLQMPAGVVVAFLAFQATMFAGTIVLFRALMRRRRVVLSVLAAPAAWAAGEYFMSLVSPGGAFPGLAYTQADTLPVIQLASATGVWGVSFVLMATPAALAVLCVPTVARAAWPKVVALVAVLSAVTLGYGFWHLHTIESAPSVTIALLDVRQSEDSLPLRSPEGRTVLDTYLEQLPALASSGATIAVLPEKVFKVTSTDIVDLGDRLTVAAAVNRTTIVIGLTFEDDTGVHNVAMAYTANGAVRYDKQHLVPGWEDDFTPGNELVSLPDTQIGLAICKDMDYPALARRYAGQGVSVLLVPALDVDRDGWLHSRSAMVRGVETAVPIARSAGRGRLTASDANGRVLADIRTTAGTTATTVTLPAGPSTTLYVRLGDWFAWLCSVLTALALVMLYQRPRLGAASRPDRSHRHR
ncbi:nitrilase [Dactylosporangium roseum]|uniref:Nitrilase n=1 Tax=Dactylosporangium roseum TaxID=47989 RepID=A0ABY5Z4L4_9ACTN|nr:nitrilase-related carbon-nitrogen hydrolase [Dactylosporangium roseum]UWZ36412.1 nitrilase [Dactylosporangium roseum]